MVIADTGFWVALANRRDQHRARAKACLEEIGEPLISTWPVVTETCYFLLARIGTASQRAFVESLGAGASALFDLRPEHAYCLASLMETYADLPMDLADASLALLAEELGHGRILSTDTRDFSAYRWKRQEPFENVLL